MKILSFITLCLLTSSLVAQVKPTELDKSPMDESFWPFNYPIQKLNGKTKPMPVARVIYSRPQKNGRVIFNGIIKYGELWRLGANEATELEFFQPVKIDSKIVPKGRYTLFCIPNEDSWTLIINKDNYCWGNYSYNAKNDLVRVVCKVEKNAEVVENFTIYFEETKKNTQLTIMWDDLKASLPITL